MDGFTETLAQIPCCLCGVLITPNPSNMCANCLHIQDDFGDKISLTNYLNYCGTCGRYQSIQTVWINADLESPELLRLCLKRITGLKDFKIIDAKFIWTEPHSKRIKITITIEKETFNETILRRSLVIVFTIKNVQCPDCCEAATSRSHWKAIVQLRQHSEDLRTIYWIEQQILSHDMHSATTAIERKQDGLDFQFNDKPSADRFLNFIKNYSPVEVKSSNKLAGQDLQNNTYDLRFTYSVKCPSCSRQDLILVPNHIYEMTGSKSRIMLCHSSGKFLTLIDPFQGNTIKLDGKQYWSKPFDPLMTHKQLKRFAIISKELIHAKKPVQAKNEQKNVPKKGKRTTKKAARRANHFATEEGNDDKNSTVQESLQSQEPQETLTNDVPLPIVVEEPPPKFQLAEVELTDEETYTDRILVRTHLGHLLNEGDVCLAYDLRDSVFPDDISDALHRVEFLSGLVIAARARQAVKKKKKKRQRKFQLKKLAPIADEAGFESFMDELEQDEELRNGVLLYHADRVGTTTTDDDDEIDGVLNIIDL